ncbi:hypothetical protein THAOC_35145 [Thalassiosira oceanica]|uniref:Uncharacterized protein n=1 Tax=Thalassiosira oceanica TaxID=159749 RepID=K0R2C4_THAOC|nr:hypothetical protein THAOC_35145 [Thalassiosira oceanica]|eukprot:EJK46195.1 hypothetical protein THAOC_35145 [Thalassiosira oceanica]
MKLSILLSVAVAFLGAVSTSARLAHHRQDSTDLTTADYDADYADEEDYDAADFFEEEGHCPGNPGRGMCGRNREGPKTPICCCRRGNRMNPLLPSRLLQNARPIPEVCEWTCPLYANNGGCPS